jgi:hypothetical protein
VLRIICAHYPSHLGLSSGDTEQAVHKTHFSYRPGFEHQALPLADHAHHLEAFDRRRSCWQRLESSRRVYQQLQRAVIRLQTVVEILDLPVLNALLQLPSPLERADGLSVSLILITVDRSRRTV